MPGIPSNVDVNYNITADSAAHASGGEALGPEEKISPNPAPRKKTVQGTEANILPADEPTAEGTAPTLALSFNKKMASLQAQLALG